MATASRPCHKQRHFDVVSTAASVMNDVAKQRALREWSTRGWERGIVNSTINGRVSGLQPRKGRLLRWIVDRIRDALENMSLWLFGWRRLRFRAVKKVDGWNWPSAWWGDWTLPARFDAMTSRHVARIAYSGCSYHVKLASKLCMKYTYEYFMRDFWCLLLY